MYLYIICTSVLFKWKLLIVKYCFDYFFLIDNKYCNKSAAVELLACSIYLKIKSAT